MHAINKKNLKTFSPSAEDVCRIEDGNTNTYLREARAIEEFLKTVEPKYNSAVDKLGDGKVDRECIYTIAGFAAYIISCSPAGMRIHSKGLQGIVETEAAMLDSQGLIPAPPPELGGLNLTEILNKGIVRVDVDPKFPQAIGISSILENVAMFGNFSWEILRNEFEDSPYFTSDYPIAIEETVDAGILNKIVPLSPNLAIRIRPDRTVDRAQVDFSFSRFNFKVRELKRSEVSQANKLIVRCAEELVFFRDNHRWISRFVQKHSRFRIDTSTHKMPYRNGMIMVATQKISGAPT